MREAEYVHVLKPFAFHFRKMFIAILRQFFYWVGFWKNYFVAALYLFVSLALGLWYSRNFLPQFLMFWLCLFFKLKCFVFIKINWYFMMSGLYVLVRPSPRQRKTLSFRPPLLWLLSLSLCLSVPPFCSLHLAFLPAFSLCFSFSFGIFDLFRVRI